MNEAQAQKLVDDVSEIKTSLVVHLAEHRVIANFHKVAYGLLTGMVGSLAGLLVTHWK